MSCTVIAFFKIIITKKAKALVIFNGCHARARLPCLSARWKTRGSRKRRDLWVRSFWMIWIRISNARSIKSWCFKGADESVRRLDSSFPLMCHELSDPGSLTQIKMIPKEHTTCNLSRRVYYIYHLAKKGK